MDGVRRQLPAWKILSAVLALLAVLAGSVVLWIDRVGARRQQELRRRVHELHAEANARDHSRPPLRGKGIPGNAWEDYSRALSEFSIVRDDRLIRMCYHLDPKADFAKLAQLLQSGERVFVHLRQGTERTINAFPYRWEEGLAFPLRPLHAIDSIAWFAACRARQLAKEGNPAEAVRLMMDLHQFGRDMVDFGQHQADMVSWIALLELKDLLCEEPLSAQELSFFAADLERIDRDLPKHTPFSLDGVVLLGYELLKPESERIHDLRASMWDHRRSVFCRRIGDADAFDRVLAGVRKSMAYQGRQDNSFMVRLAAEVLIPRNPVVENFWPGPSYRSWDPTPHWRARLRLLRVAAHYRATGEILSLEDPMGKGPLGHELQGRRLRVWTVWENGQDDQGDDEGVGWPKSRPMPVPGKRPAYAKDVVIQVDR